MTTSGRHIQNGETKPLLNRDNAEASAVLVQKSGQNKAWGVGALFNGTVGIIAGGGALYFAAEEGGAEKAKLCGAVAAVAIANTIYNAIGWKNTSVVQIGREDLAGATGLVDITVLSSLQNKSSEEVLESLDQIKTGIETQIRSLLRQIHDKPSFEQLGDEMFETKNDNPAIATKLRAIHDVQRQLRICRKVFEREKSLRDGFDRAIALLREVLPNIEPTGTPQRKFADPQANEKYHMLTCMIQALQSEKTISKNNREELTNSKTQIAQLAEQLGAARARLNGLEGADGDLPEALARVAELESKLKETTDKKVLYREELRELRPAYQEAIQAVEASRAREETITNMETEARKVDLSIRDVIQALEDLTSTIGDGSAPPVQAFSNVNAPGRMDDLIETVNILITRVNTVYHPSQSTPSSRASTPASSPAGKQSKSLAQRRVSEVLERRKSSVSLQGSPVVLSDEEE